MSMLIVQAAFDRCPIVSSPATATSCRHSPRSRRAARSGPLEGTVEHIACPQTHRNCHSADFISLPAPAIVSHKIAHVA